MSDAINKLNLINPVLSARTMSGVSGNTGKKDLEKACHDFESLFVNYMFQQMRATIPEESLFGGGQAENIFTGMLDTEVSKSISQERGLGLARIMYNQMSASLQNTQIKK